MKTYTESLLLNLEAIDRQTHWIQIAKECSMEKQIEIRAEITRAIKRIKKELDNGK